MKKQLLLSLLLCASTLSVLPANAEQANPMASGAAMAWQCAPCHGTNGQEFLEAMPPLAGMPVEQFTRAMLAYRDGTRPAVIMDRVARGFTDAEIDAMAVWFEKQPLKQWENTSLNEALKAQADAQGVQQ
ncbi:MAG: cytochrome C [Thiotrichales bacterium]|nr:cytochrome C [Thiotrichales bacterium]